VHVRPSGGVALCPIALATPVAGPGVPCVRSPTWVAGRHERRPGVACLTGVARAAPAMGSRRRSIRSRATCVTCSCMTAARDLVVPPAQLLQVNPVPTVKGHGHCTTWASPAQTPQPHVAWRTISRRPSIRTIHPARRRTRSRRDTWRITRRRGLVGFVLPSASGTNAGLPPLGADRRIPASVACFFVVGHSARARDGPRSDASIVMKRAHRVGRARRFPVVAVR